MQEIRNIAIIAHVDHGKTTLVDRMIYQANLVRRPEDLGNLILDNNDWSASVASPFSRRMCP